MKVMAIPSPEKPIPRAKPRLCVNHREVNPTSGGPIPPIPIPRKQPKNRYNCQLDVIVLLRNHPMPMSTPQIAVTIRAFHLSAIMPQSGAEKLMATNVKLGANDAKVRESSSSVLNGLKKIPNELRVLHAIPNVSAKVPVITHP